MSHLVFWFCDLESLHSRTSLNTAEMISTLAVPLDYCVIVQVIFQVKMLLIPHFQPLHC